MDKTADYTSVQQFYAGKTLFITGCTGFVGKVLLEKLLRSCPDIECVYILGRGKRGQTLLQRFNDIFNSALFDRVRKESPSAFEKVKYIEGDLLQDMMGISDNDLDLLRKQVDVVIHSAASVRFDEPLKNAVNMNLCGTKKLLDLCLQMNHLQVFCHVSTCYANCDVKVIEERVYEPKYDPERIIEMVQWMDDEALDAVQAKLLGNKPNTYTFTKSLTEVLVDRYRSKSNFNVTIVRPSIVVASKQEPMAGWVDNFNGPSGLICATACGLLRSVYSCPQMRTDMIPVDIVANTIAVACWNVCTRRDKSPTVVFNCALGDRAPPFKWVDFEDYQSIVVERIVFDNAVRYPSLSMRQNWFTHRASMLLEHYLPAYICDLASQVVGKKPKFLKIYAKLLMMQKALEFFTTHEWTFKTDNVEMLYESMSEEDRQEFTIDLIDFSWEEFLVDYIRGCRDYVLKEKHKAESNWFQRLYLVEQLKKAAFAFALYKTLGVGEMVSSAIDHFV